MYINGNNFSDIADFVIDPDHLEIDFPLNENAIIYCKTDYLGRLFQYIKHSQSKYVLITHMSDQLINKVRFEKKPDCVKKWFAENTVYNHSDLISIPLGLENHRGSCKGGFTDHKWIVNNVERLRRLPKSFSLYCNWCSYSNKSLRNLARTARKIALRQLRILVDIKMRINDKLPFSEYCEEMARYKFVICPRGNGIDTHRVWETLYVGCIPIVIKHRIYQDYTLPIIQVNDWTEVTLNRLKTMLQSRFDYTMMDIKYWKNKITEEFNKL